MKQFLILCSICLVWGFAVSCGNPKQQQVEQQTEQQVKTDQERMDSMDRVIQQQMQSVSDDSVLKSAQE